MIQAALLLFGGGCVAVCELRIFPVYVAPEDKMIKASHKLLGQVGLFVVYS
jgi:hypothetical protein